DDTFDESVPFFRLFPYRSAPLPPPPLFLAPGPPPVDPLPPQGPAPSGVSHVDPLPGTVPIEVVVDSGPARGAASGGAASGSAASGGAEPARVECGGAEPRGAEPMGTELAGAEPDGAEPEGAESEGAEPGGAEYEGAESRGAEPRGTASSGGPAGALPRLSPQSEPLSPQQLREWFAQRTRLRSGAAAAGGSAAGGTGAGGAGATSLRGVGFPAGAGGTGGAGATSPGGARTSGTGAAGAGGVGSSGAVGAGARDPGAGGPRAGGAGAGDPGAGGAGAGDPGAGGTGAGGARAGGARAGGAGAVDLGAGGAGAEGVASGSTGARGTVQRQPFFVPPPPSSMPPPDSPDSPLPAPSPYVERTESLTERREPESRLASPVRAVRTGCRVPRPRPPSVPGTHVMALRPSSVPLRVPLPPPPESSLLAVPNPESGLARAATPTVSRLLATVVTDPSFEFTAASALVAELVDFAAACCLDYATSLLAESEQEDFQCLAAAVSHLVAMLLAPEEDPDAPDIPTPRSYLEAITGPYSSQWQTAMDAEMASWKSTGTYVDAVPPSGANIVDGMWIFKMKRPSGSPPVFKARYVARGFSQRQRVDFFQTFSPTPRMTTLRVLLHVAAQRDYKLHSLDFSTAFLQGSLHEEIWLRRPPGFTGSFPAGTQWSHRWPVYGLRQAPCEWHDTLRTTLAALGFAPSTADPSLFLRTDTSLPPFYVLVYVDDLVFATADTEALALVKPKLQKRHTCTDLGELRSYLGLQFTQDRARRTITLTQSHMVHQYIEHGARTWRGRGPIVLTRHADASWVDDLATQRLSQGYTFSLGSGSVYWRSNRSSSRPLSSPVLYVDNKAMIALGQEHRLEHRSRHIALLYFLAREFQQRGQLRLAYMATWANTADIFTKALQSGGSISSGVGPHQQPHQQQPQQRQQHQQGHQQWEAPQQFRWWGPPLQWGPQQHWGPPPQWGPGGPGSTGRNSSTTSWAPRPPWRDTGPCDHWCVTGPSSLCVYGRDDHSVARCFRRLDDLYHARWGPEATTPRWAHLLARKIPVFELSMDDARQYALYAYVDYGADGFVCSRVRSLGCLPPVSVDLCLSSLGACVSALGACVASGLDTPPAEVSLSFTLDSSASQCFFRDHTTLTPLLALVAVALADPSSGPAVARSSTTLPCPVVPSGVLRGLHIPSFTQNLVGAGYLQDRGITVTFVGGGRTAVCTDTATGAVLATFTRESRSGLYVLHTERSPVDSSVQVVASPQVPLSSPVVVSGQVEVSGLPRVFPTLPPSLAPPCTPCGLAPTLGPERERYFLVVFDDYSMYTTVFPLTKKSEVTSMLIRWLMATEGTRGSRVRCLHSDCGAEFRSDVLAGCCGKQGNRQSWMLPKSPQQNGVAECRIGLVMDIARTSMIHARAPIFYGPTRSATPRTS
ncbi:unnamed protein product, partial [Closterium sp. NIES-53]